MFNFFHLGLTGLSGNSRAVVQEKVDPFFVKMLFRFIPWIFYYLVFLQSIIYVFVNFRQLDL